MKIRQSPASGSHHPRFRYEPAIGNWNRPWGYVLDGHKRDLIVCISSHDICKETVARLNKSRRD